MSRRLFWLLAAIVPALLIALLPAQTGKRKGTRYAFLVACSGYDKAQLKPLPYTVNDVEEFKKALLDTGFEEANIKVLHDRRPQRRYLSEKAKIVRELNLLLDGLRPQDTVVVALSGHGIHFKGDKTGYFCPVDARLSDRKTLLPMEGKDGLFELLKGCKAKRKLLIVNACRNDPASDLAQAAKKIDLDDVDNDAVPEGIAALYSCRAGQKSYYDTDRKRAFFFDHLTRAWRGEYRKGDGPLKLEDLFEQVVTRTKADVDRTLGEAQVPVVRREYSGDWAIEGTNVKKGPKEITVDLGGGVRMEFVRIPKGTFLMGSKAGNLDEKQHEVEITRDFYLGKYEVTQEQYQAVMGENPSYFSAKGFGEDEVKGLDTSRFPVDRVSWEDAVRFCEKLKEKDRLKRKYRLPTEAEWEYACRAGSSTPFHFGKELNGKQANCDGRRPYGTTEKGPFLRRTCRVGSYRANAFGLYDMHGNVYEWCQDWYDKNYYGNSGKKDPSGPEKGDARVLRGGSFSYDAGSCLAAYRYRDVLQAPRRYACGFRVCFRLD